MPITISPVGSVLTRFNRGAWEDSLALAREALRANPQDVGLRAVLAELLCFQGAFEKADQQLDTAMQMAPDHAVGLGQMRRIVHAAAARSDFFARGRMPAFLVEPSEAMHHRLRAALALREHRYSAAVEELSRAEAASRPVAGTCDGRAFEQFRDLDDLVGSVLEVLTADGRYCWIPFEAVRALELEPPRRPRDLCFRPARLRTPDGNDATVFLPVLYEGSAESGDDAIRLGRATNWHQPGGGPVRGLGQRMWLAGEEEAAALDVRRLEFHSAP